MLDEKRKKEIMESTDPSMDEIGYVVMHHSGNAFGATSTSISMTKREALLNDFEGWISYRENEEAILKQEEEIRIKEEKLQKEIDEIFKENPELDSPKVYEVLVRSGDGLTPRIQTSKEYRILTERQAMAAGLIGSLNGSNTDIEIIRESDFTNETIEKELETARERIETIYNNDNPTLDKKGKSSEISKKYGVSVSMTLKQAMLASPDFDESKIGFKTYEQIEQARKEKETEKEEPKSKITFLSIKNAIKKALGKESR